MFQTRGKQNAWGQMLLILFPAGRKRPFRILQHFANKRRRIANPVVAPVVQVVDPVVKAVAKVAAPKAVSQVLVPGVHIAAPAVAKVVPPVARSTVAPPQSPGQGRGRGRGTSRASFASLAAARGQRPVIDLDDSRGKGPVIDLDDSEGEMSVVKAVGPKAAVAPAKRKPPIVKVASAVAKATNQLQRIHVPVNEDAPAVAKAIDPVVKAAPTPAVAKAVDLVIKAAPVVAKAIDPSPAVAKAVEPVGKAAPAVAKAVEPVVKAVGAPLPAAFPAPAIADISLAEVTPFASVLGLDVQLHGNAWMFTLKESGGAAGRVNPVGQGYKATCKRHANCFCFLSCPPAANRSRFVFDDLMRWIATDCSEQQHYELSQKLRVWKYRMKVKGP